MTDWFKKYTVVLLLLVTAVIGLLTYKNYGCGWDESMQREIGSVSYEYVVNQDQKLFDFHSRYHGVAFELPLIALEKAFGLTTFRDVILMRHIVTHAIFLLSAFFCFLLVDFLYKSKLLASIGFLLIVLNPRLYAHSFFNSKDIPFMAMFLICFYVSAIAFDRKRARYFALLGIVTGLLINLRVMGLLMVCCVFLFLIVDVFMVKKNPGESTAKPIRLAGVFLGATCITLYISWPLLWSNPVEHFILAFKSMSKFPWQGTVLFNGELIKATEISWDYAPTWFAVTTPLLYLFTGLYGIVLLGINCLKHPMSYLSNTPLRNNLIFALCFFVPVIAVIFLNSVLYDGWRHLYFIYPGFALLVVYGLSPFIKSRLKPVVVVWLIIAFCPTGYFMIENAPFQNVFFNNLVRNDQAEDIRKKFELDYWGTSYKQSLEYIQENDTSPEIFVFDLMTPLELNLKMVQSEKTNRIKLTKDANIADYFVTNYRGHPQDFPFEKNKWHAIKVKNNTINAIYKFKE